MDTGTSSEKRGQVRTVVVVLALVAILLLGAAFRFYNVNWDEDTYHIHPDERHTTMVVTAIQWPESFVEYLDTSHSSLNPRNNNTVYFYGTLPLFLTKYVATQAETLAGPILDAQTDPDDPGPMRLSLTSYDRIHLVGRVLSGLFDLGSVLLLFFLARRLFDWRVGLISSLLLALAALNIQGSHYFTVDTFLTFWVALTIWFTLDVAEGKGWTVLRGPGHQPWALRWPARSASFSWWRSSPLGAWVWVRRQAHAGKPVGRSLMRAVWGLILAAGISLVIFRLVQPYAWAGPNYDGWDTVPEPWGERVRVFERLPEPLRALVMPNPQWIADISSAGAQQTGEADLPWGRQWTERTPWLYPLENMVLWGLGVPLGIAAWLGVGLVVVQLVVRAWKRRRAVSGANSDVRDAVVAHLQIRDEQVGGRDEQGEASDEQAGRRDKQTKPAVDLLRNWDLILIPLAWVLLTFFWQGMQYVKSIRYFMPIYPYLAMFAAYLVVSAWDWASGLPRGKGRGIARVLAGVLGAFVLVGTLAWAWAFLQIYREPMTRVQASRWIYENVEAGATLRYRTAAGESGQLQIPHAQQPRLRDRWPVAGHALYAAP